VMVAPMPDLEWPCGGWLNERAASEIFNFYKSEIGPL